MTSGRRVGYTHSIGGYLGVAQRPARHSERLSKTALTLRTMHISLRGILLSTALVVALACTREVVTEVPVERNIIVDQPVVKQIPIERLVVVEREVVREVPVEKIVTVEHRIVRDLGPVGNAETVLHMRTSSEVQRLSPFTGASGYVSLANAYLFSNLVMADPTRHVFSPELAARWEVTPDGTSYTFYLREDALFHDGVPVTARDVAFTFTAYAGHQTSSHYVDKLSMIEGARDFREGQAEDVVGVVVLDDHTIRFDLISPSGFFLDALYVKPILPDHLLGRVAPEQLDTDGFFVDGMVGSGPYRLAQRRPGHFIQFEANPDYFLGEPKIEAVLVHLIKSPEVAHAAMQRGEIDVNRRGHLSMGTYKALLQDPRFEIAAVATQRTSAGYAFNSRTDWLEDPRIRQAAMLALDRRELVDRFVGGLGVINNTCLFMPVGVVTEQMKRKYPESGDSARAKGLLSDAGWDDDRAVTVKTPAPANLDQASMHNAEQAMLGDAGLRIVFEEMDTPSWAVAYYEEHDYDSVRVGGWGGSLSGAYFYFHSAFTDAMGYASPKLDSLLNALPSALTRAEQERIGQQVNEMFIEDLPILPIYSSVWLGAYAAHVYVPGFGTRPQPSDLGRIMVTPEFKWHAEWFYHLEQWEISE